ncbi:MAG: hypothetical protein HDP28_02865 [Clostridia bacterium]|nr:hypothetical protein [Clostridia bacterium]
MFCRHCGKELADEAFMCPGCGSPTGTAPIKQEVKKEDESGEKTSHHSGLSTIAFILSLIAFVTGIVFGALFLACSGSFLLLYFVGTMSVLPALAALSIGAYLLCARNKLIQNAKAFAITAIVLSAVVLLFLFISGCLTLTGYTEYYSIM